MGRSAKSERAMRIMQRRDTSTKMPLRTSTQQLRALLAIVCQAAMALAYSSRNRPRALNSSVSMAEQDTPSRSAMER